MIKAFVIMGIVVAILSAIVVVVSFVAGMWKTKDALNNTHKDDNNKS